MRVNPPGRGRNTAGAYPEPTELAFSTAAAMFQCALRIVQYGAKRCLTAMQRAGEICVGAKDGAEAGEAGGKTETSMGAPARGLDVGTTEARFTSSALVT